MKKKKALKMVRSLCGQDLDTAHPDDAWMRIIEAVILNEALRNELIRKAEESGNEELVSRIIDLNLSLEKKRANR